MPPSGSTTSGQLSFCGSPTRGRGGMSVLLMGPSFIVCTVGAAVRWEHEGFDCEYGWGVFGVDDGHV